MTTLVTVPSPVNPTTYLDRLNSAFQHNTNSVLPIVKELSERISKPLDLLSAHVQGFILNNRLDELRPCLTAGCDMYNVISKGHAAATQALAQFNATLAYIPEKIMLPVEVSDHLIKLNVMTVYSENEAACATNRTALVETIGKLKELVTNTHTFMESMKGPLNTIAYQVKRMENKTGIFDRLPSRGYYYFDEALAAFLNPVQESTTSVAATEGQELGELKTAPKVETPKAKNAVAELAASLS